MEHGRDAWNYEREVAADVAGAMSTLARTFASLGGVPPRCIKKVKACTSVPVARRALRAMESVGILSAGDRDRWQVADRGRLAALRQAAGWVPEDGGADPWPASAAAYLDAWASAHGRP